MREPPLLSVIIPNWNGVRFLQTCLDALRSQTYPRVEVIVVDNASTDGSPAFIADHYPEMRLLALPENRGFTGACNAGFDAAQGELVALLNNDTQVAPTWAAEAVAAFERHPEAGLVASKMLLFDQRDTLHAAGDLMRTNGLPGNRGVWTPDGPQYSAEEYVFSACGGASIYRRALLDAIGVLDDDFFFSLEDVDLSWRAQLSGWRCVYAPRAVVYHHLSATGGGATASYYNGRNLMWLIAKNMPGPLLRRYGRQIVRAQLRIAKKALRAWRGEAARARLRGMLAGLWGLPRALRKRRAIQRMRSESVEAIDWMLTPEPAVPESAAVILERADGCIVMQLRDGERYAGCWGLFGGWVEPDETPQAALLREIAEELAIRLDDTRLTYLGSRYRADKSALAHVFHYRLHDGELEGAVLGEGSAFEALSAEQIAGRPVVPVYRAILDAYRAGAPLNAFHLPGREG